MKVSCWIIAIGLASGLGFGAETMQEPPHQLSAAQRQERMATVSAGMTKTLAKFERQMARPDPTPSIRDLPNAALTALFLGKEPAEAERFLKIAFTQQDMDPASKDFGSVPWQIGHPEIKDENAIDFVNQAVGPILIQYGQKLSPRFKAWLEPHMKASFASMLRRKLRVNYTNIWLMRAVNMVLMGQAIKDTTAEDEGYKELDQWIDYTRQSGVHEFESPTYYLVDLDSLAMAYLDASRPQGKAKFKALLDYFWTDIAANYFAPNGVISGPNSRNYSFVSSSGGLDLILYTEGFRSTDDMPRLNFEDVFLMVSGVANGYHPGPELYALANEPVRVVVSRWDSAPYHDRYHYLTPEFSIGSASGDYCAHDKLIEVELAGSSLPVIAVVPDVFDSPYGTVKTADRSGHQKPTHVPYRPLCVQDKGILLALLDVDPARLAPTDSLATDIILPAHAQQITVGGKALDMKKAFETSVAQKCVVGVRNGDCGVALRIFHVDACKGQKPQAMIKLDAAGMKVRAARYVAYQYQGPQRKLEDKHLGFGLLIIARKCSTDADYAELLRDTAAATIQDSRAGDKWSASATVGKLNLSIVRSLKTGGALSMQVNHLEVVMPPLMVNGREIVLAPAHPAAN